MGERDKASDLYPRAVVTLVDGRYPIVVAHLNEREYAVFQRNGSWNWITPLLLEDTVRKWRVWVRPPVLVADAGLAEWLEETVASQLSRGPQPT